MMIDKHRIAGRNGGLAVLWKEKVKCSVMNFSRNFVNFLIQDEVKGGGH